MGLDAAKAFVLLTPKFLDHLCEVFVVNLSIWFGFFVLWAVVEGRCYLVIDLYGTHRLCEEGRLRLLSSRLP